MRLDLLDALRVAHTYGWIHRDFKPNNVFVDQMNLSRIVINDWRSAARTDEACPFAGTVLLFADRPNAYNYHVPTAALDLRCLVRTMFCVTKQRLPWVEKVDWETLEAFWTEVEQSFP